MTGRGRKRKRRSTSHIIRKSKKPRRTMSRPRTTRKKDYRQTQRY